ncbi:MAG: NADH-quinone oxidoreductase subunit N [Anaerolineae bacterium]|nr:NADH-quinone oxidoreductase subunit N [Anaerolineae bacterium]
MMIDVGRMMLEILPEIGLLILIGVVLVLDLFWRKSRKKLGWVSFAGLLLIFVLTLVFVQPARLPQLTWGGMISLDMTGYIFRMIFIAGAALTVLYAIANDSLAGRGEFYLLLLTSTLGMCFMASAADLIMLFLAIETTTVPLFVLAGFLTRDQKSVESGIKYLLFAAMTSAVMLYGFTWLYGFSGTTQLYQIAERLKYGFVPQAAVVAAMMLVLVGFGFKISAVPFHFWAPDVYDGAPYPVAGFLSTASKAAGFAVLARALFVIFPLQTETWTLIVALLSTASMFVGNLLALAQKNIKRLLAYSSIAQAGYILIGVAADSPLGTSGVIYYLSAYLLTNLAAFGIVALVGRAVGSDEISAYAGLSRRSPALALAMLVVMLSLGGIPPFAGFIGKLLVFAAAIERGLIWLAILGVINTIVALFYYLTVLKVIYLYRSEEEDKPLAVSSAAGTALVICIVGIIALGVVIAPLYGWSTDAAATLLFLPR